MKIWVDAQLSPVIAQWITSTYGMEAVAVRTLRLRTSPHINLSGLKEGLGKIDMAKAVMRRLGQEPVRLEQVDLT